MAATAIAPTVINPNGYALTGTVVTWTACDNANGNMFASTGREILHYKATAGPFTLTVTAQPDISGRSAAGDNFVQVVGSGAEGVTQMFPRLGWADSNGNIQIPAPPTGLSFWVERVPF